FARHLLLQVRHHIRQVDMEPPQVRRQRQSKGTRVESGRQVENGLRSVVHAAQNDLIHDRGPDDHRPCHLRAAWHRAHDRCAALRQRSAELLLKLYDQRREPALRAARDWFVTQFQPASAREILALWISAESASYRMVTTYWEMAASFVTAGAIDADMFHAANTEYVAVWAKMAPHIVELRKIAELPDYLESLEKVIAGIPDEGQKLASMQKYLSHPARRKAGF